MKTALSIAAFALLVVVIAGILVGVYDVHRFLRTANEDLSDLHGTIDQASTGLRQLDQTFAKVNTAADTLNAAAGEERENWKATSADVKKTGEDTRRVVAHVDRILTRLNQPGGTVDILDAQIQGNGTALEAAIGNLGATAAKLGDTADGATAVTKTLDARVADPQITQLIGHFNTISGNLADTTGDVQHEIHKFVYPPPRKWWQKYITDPANQLRKMFEFTHPLG